MLVLFVLVLFPSLAEVVKALIFLQSTIGAFSSIAERNVVENRFDSTMTKLLKATRISQKSNSMQVDSSSKEFPPHLAR